MLSRGVYLAPSQFEAAFVSLAHGDAEIEATARGGARELRGDRKLTDEIREFGQEDEMLKLQFHGHSCWELDDGNHRVLIDPFLTGNPLADVGPDAFDKLDAIIVTHGHGDHLGDSIEIAKRTGALVVSNFEIVN